MITLYQFHRVWNLPNASIFCMRVETYLRMTGIAHEVQFINNPQQAPKGKLPYIQLDGVLYPDSEFIIDELKTRYGNTLDQDLTEEQRAVALLIEHACCERLYWIVVYLRWQNETGWAQVKPDFFCRLPTIPKLFVPEMIRKRMIKALYYQGTGRHTLDEVIYLGRKTIDALVTLLGDKPYFLGDKPTSVDATTFSFIANLLMTPVNDGLKEYALKIDALKSYCNRMWDAFYSDFTKPHYVIPAKV